ncbi:unnamed protein product [Sphenostylis stenocarpa]|uniref:Uncharacterized protein n=1 Tax=Sphenostylis stenocarpa TaxID=92480 RepID=A0AA87B8Q0_9FABA|nr:unnamed protein product [Sphenostylis stenocarpa]
MAPHAKIGHRHPCRIRVEDDVRAHIDSIGWRFLLQSPPTHVYPQAVLEFLASISYADTPSMVSSLSPTKMVTYFMGGIVDP